MSHITYITQITYINHMADKTFFYKFFQTKVLTRYYLKKTKKGFKKGSETIKKPCRRRNKHKAPICS